MDFLDPAPGKLVGWTVSRQRLLFFLVPGWNKTDQSIRGPGGSFLPSGWNRRRGPAEAGSESPSAQGLLAKPGCREGALEPDVAGDRHTASLSATRWGQAAENSQLGKLSPSVAHEAFQS